MNGGFLLNPSVHLQQLTALEVISCNALTACYGLALTVSEAQELVETHSQILHNYGRLEFTGGTITKIIRAFSSSSFLTQSNYVETLADLVETFYYFKNETLDEISDDELIDKMKRYFENDCHGCMELMQNRELEALARNIRYGYGTGDECAENPSEFGQEE